MTGSAKGAAVGRGRLRGTGDAAAIARASRSVTVQITLAAAAIVALIVAACVAFIIDQSQPRERLEPARAGQTKIYVDASDMLIALVVVGALAIILAGVLSGVIARRAVRPLGDALRAQRTFVADASHELRTPLAVIAARAEVLKQEIADGDDTAANLAALSEDVAALGDILSDLLLQAAPAQSDRVHAAAVDAVVGQAITDLRILAEQHDVRLTLTIEKGISTPMPAPALRRCVVALVDNAIGHSPAGSEVEVTVASARGGRWFTLVVVDHGSGIKGLRPDRVFERFARGEGQVDGASHPGSGIGLALVRDLADRYGGGIALTDTSDAGTTFTLTLPRS